MRCLLKAPELDLQPQPVLPGEELYQLTQQGHGLVAAAQGAADLALDVAAVVLDADVGPGPDIHEAPPQHLRVQGGHLSSDVGLELLKGCRPWSKDLVLQYSPDGEVKDVQVWGARGPGPASDTLPGDQPPIELVLKVGDVAPSTMTGGTVLYERQSEKHESVLVLRVDNVTNMKY